MTEGDRLHDLILGVMCLAAIGLALATVGWIFWGQS